MNGLYADTLEEGFVFDGKVLQEAIRKIYGKDFNTLTDIERGLWNEFWKAFNEATDTGFHKRSPFQDDYAFYRELRYNNAVFAAFKAHRFQNDIASQLLDEDGQLKPFDIFKRDVEKFVSPLHLESWLQTEYATAVIRAHQASDWRRFERDKDVLPRLRWVESTSVHPGEDHRVFWGIIRSIDDPFWSAHRPGDRWNCKCSLEATDEAETMRNSSAIPIRIYKMPMRERKRP